MSLWVTLDPGDPGTVPNSPACYVIYIDGSITYIGQTLQLRKRLIAGHRIDIARYSNGYLSVWGQVRDIKVKANFGKAYGDWAMREIRLIRRLKPPQNCVGSVKKRGAKAA